VMDRVCNRKRRWRAALAPALTAACLAAGCTRQSSPSGYEVISGTVGEVHPETGQLTVRSGAAWVDSGKERALACLLTGDAEVYVNDRFSGFEALQVGDAIEVIAYRDPTSQAERFVVCFAYVTRPEPPAPVPDLGPPATQSGHQPQESTACARR